MTALPLWHSLDDFLQQYQSRQPLVLDAQRSARVQAAYDYLQGVLADQSVLHYGINTGFGSLCDVRIGAEDLEQLQLNLIRSHACGLGEAVPQEIVRWMLLLKWHNLSLGYSAVHPDTLQRLADFYQANVLPVVFELGSLGASGDLAPLAHLSLPLVGEGEVWFEGERRSSAEVLQALGWKPIRLHAKEGLALLNGTQFSLSYGLASYTKAAQLLEWADLIAALSIEAFACKHSPFDERLHLIRPQAGQVATAANLRYWLQGSEIAQALPAMSVQDPYAFRCVPQVHGASRDALGYVANVLCTEANSVTDNPNVFYETQAILSGGNFHAQPLALALDFMAIALAELGSISERRLYQLIGGKRELPPFLTQHSGLHSGLMIAQYTAASIVSQNKQLCTPASVDSIVSCNGQEDHVSMAANAGTKLYRVVQNLERLLAIELLAACQAISLRGLALAPRLRACYAAFRKEIPFLEADRFLSKDLHRAIDFLREQSHFLAK